MFRSIIAFFVILSSSLRGQEPSLRGLVHNSVNHRPLYACTIILSGNGHYKTLTDSLGSYYLALPPGKYTLTALKPGYKSHIAEEVIVSSGKQQIIELELNEFSVPLDTIPVIEKTASNEIAITSLSTQKYAASFYDPARMVTTHASLINTDDQANNISVRGTSPNYMQWKMEGVETVNPNHLENAGTINDKPSLNGGGVSMISAQLLHNSVFNLPAFDASCGNVLSGLFDIRLRKGNDEKSEKTIQASLLGLDACFEGPFSKKSKASYVVNARYSTVGMLSKLGVNFGGEKIDFRDISYQLAFPINRGILKIFGIAGNSYNTFAGQTDSSLAQSEKDLQNINYNSTTIIQGLGYLTSIGNNAHFKTTVAWSGKKISRDQVPTSNEWSYVNSVNDTYEQQKLSSNSYVAFRIATATNLKAGALLNYFVNSVVSSVNDSLLMNTKLYDPLYQPYVSAQVSIKKFDLDAGLHGFYQQRLDYFLAQPRAMLRYNAKDNLYFALSAGQSAQLQPIGLYAANNKNLKPTIVNHAAIAQYLKIKSISVKTGLFYQVFSQVPINVDKNFSAFNYFNEVVTFSLSSAGSAKVYGADMSISATIRQFYFILSGCLYKSVFSFNGNTWYDARFNSNYNAVFTAGKQIKLKTKNRTMDFNLRSVLRNGFLTSTDIGAAYYSYDVRLPVYSRTDFRVSLRRDKTQVTTILALDIQNLFNQQNVAYYYFDSFTRKTETRYQLGLIPVLSYKVLF